MEPDDLFEGRKIRLARKEPDGPGWMPEMEKLLGKIVTVCDCYDDEVYLEECPNEFAYDASWFDPVDSSELPFEMPEGTCPKCKRWGTHSLVCPDLRMI